MQFVPGETEEEREWRQQQEMEEMRSRRATEQDQVDWWQDREDDLMSQVDAIRRDSGGHFTPAGQQEYDSLISDIGALRRDQEGTGDDDGRLTASQYHKARAQRIQGYLGGFRPDEAITAIDQRPGYEKITDNGRLLRREADGSYKDVGLAPWDRLTPEQREAYKESHFDTDPQGRPGQWVTDTHGRRFEPDEQEKAAPSYSDQVEEALKKRNSIREGLFKDRGINPDPDMRDDKQKAAAKEANDRVDSLVPMPPDPGAGGGGGNVPVVKATAGGVVQPGAIPDVGGAEAPQQTIIPSSTTTSAAPETPMGGFRDRGTPTSEGDTSSTSIRDMIEAAGGTVGGTPEFSPENEASHSSGYREVMEQQERERATEEMQSRRYRSGKARRRAKFDAGADANQARMRGQTLPEYRFNQAWAKAKPGDPVEGLDGKIYTKPEE
jgi:hypothetical protein